MAKQQGLVKNGEIWQVLSSLKLLASEKCTQRVGPGRRRGRKWKTGGGGEERGGRTTSVNQGGLWFNAPIDGRFAYAVSGRLQGRGTKGRGGAD